LLTDCSLGRRPARLPAEDAAAPHRQYGFSLAGNSRVASLTCWALGSARSGVLDAIAAGPSPPRPPVTVAVVAGRRPLVTVHAWCTAATAPLLSVRLDNSRRLPDEAGGSLDHQRDLANPVPTHRRQLPFTQGKSRFAPAPALRWRISSATEGRPRKRFSCSCLRKAARWYRYGLDLNNRASNSLERQTSLPWPPRVGKAGKRAPS
jgi:hypothetical protein